VTHARHRTPVVHSFQITVRRFGDSRIAGAAAELDDVSCSRCEGRARGLRFRDQTRRMIAPRPDARDSVYEAAKSATSAARRTFHEAVRWPETVSGQTVLEEAWLPGPDCVILANHEDTRARRSSHNGVVTRACRVR